MFRPTPALQKTLRRLPLNPKQGGKDFYKGNRVGSMGTINKHGRFIVDWEKVRTYMYPEDGIENFHLTPFVPRSKETNVTEGENLWQAPAKKLTGDEYLQQWKTAVAEQDIYSGSDATGEPNKEKK